MITIFNRRELLVTFSMAQQARVRDALDAAGIDYKVKTVNRSSPGLSGGSRMRSGSLGEPPEMAYEYIIYVKKQDYDAACAAIK